VAYDTARLKDDASGQRHQVIEVFRGLVEITRIFGPMVGPPADGDYCDRPDDSG
jgi:hypothetical protein